MKKRRKQNKKDKITKAAAVMYFVKIFYKERITLFLYYLIGNRFSGKPCCLGLSL